MKRALFASLMILPAFMTSCATQKTQTSTSVVAPETKVFNAPSTERRQRFVSHSENRSMGSYVAMNLSYSPYQQLLEEVQKAEDLILKNRGEAHITLISPVEFDKVLKKHLSIKEIEKIALNAKIQDALFNPVCVGRGQKEVEGRLEKTYYVVVDSPELLEIRKAVQAAYVKKGGSAQDFAPESFYPHITLGFTSRDLHFEDGVIKNKESCLYPFKEKQ